MKTIAEIAETAGFSKPTVTAAVKKLSKENRITVTTGKRSALLVADDDEAVVIAALGDKPAQSGDAVLQAKLDGATAQLKDARAQIATLTAANAAQAEQLKQLQTLVDQGQRLLAAEQQAHAADTAKLEAPRRSWWQRLLGTPEDKQEDTKHE